MSLKESEVKVKALQQTKTKSYNNTTKCEDLYFPQLNEKDSKWPIDEEELFPCAVMTCGSGFGFCTVSTVSHYYKLSNTVSLLHRILLNFWKSNFVFLNIFLSHLADSLLNTHC